MDCDKVREEFSPLLDGELTPELRAEVETHLAECASCLRELESFKRVNTLYADLPRVAAPTDLEDRVRALLGASRVSLASRRRQWRWTSVAAVAAGVTIMAGVVWQLLQSGPEYSPEFTMATEEKLERAAPTKSHPAREPAPSLGDEPAIGYFMDRTSEAELDERVTDSIGRQAATAAESAADEAGDAPVQQDFYGHDTFESAAGGFGGGGAASVDTNGGGGRFGGGKAAVPRFRANEQLQSLGYVAAQSEVAEEPPAPTAPGASPLAEVSQLGIERHVETEEAPVAQEDAGAGAQPDADSTLNGAWQMSKVESGAVAGGAISEEAEVGLRRNVEPELRNRGVSAEDRAYFYEGIDAAKPEVQAAPAVGAPSPVAPPAAEPPPPPAPAETPRLEPRGSGEMAVVTAARTLRFRDGVWTQSEYRGEKTESLARDSENWEKLVARDPSLDDFALLEAPVIFRAFEVWYRLEAPANE